MTDKKTATEVKEQPQQPAMTKEKAFEVIATVCAQFKGNLQEHQTIQIALQTLKGDY